MSLRIAFSLLFAGAAAAAVAGPAGPEWTATRADATLDVHGAVDDELGLRITVPGAKRSAPHGDYVRDRGVLAGALTFSIAHGHYAFPEAGRLDGLRITLRAGARRETLELALVPVRDEKRGRFALVDADGAVWFAAHDVHQLFDAARGRLTMTHLDLAAGDALARWLGNASLRGRFLGALHLALDGEPQPALAKGGANCLPPVWTGTPGTTTDVVVDQLTRLDIVCPGLVGGGGVCNGNGGDPQATVKFLPSVRLSNNGTADVPWYMKFSGATPPGAYPYATLDQHPFLVWNVYRLRADGRFEQIGRSGVKHAFFTGNESCNCAGGSILFYGPRQSFPSMQQCADTYDASSNDLRSELGPRSEVLARPGIFGRCGSVFDPDCNGLENHSDPNPERPELVYRAPVRESELSATQYPGARYFIEVSYVIRDDANLYNTMGNREFTPSFNVIWNNTLSTSETIPNGPAIDRWVAPGSVAADARNTEVVTGNGRLKLAVRVATLPGGRWRYDYAVMNFDYADATTSGAEPNLRVLTNRGIGALRVPVPVETLTELHEFHDASGSAADDWPPVRAGAELTYTAPSGNLLDWGSMYRYSFVADAGPVVGNAVLDPAESAAADLVVATLVPGTSDTLFRNGFE